MFKMKCFTTFKQFQLHRQTVMTKLFQQNSKREYCLYLARIRNQPIVHNWMYKITLSNHNFTTEQTILSKQQKNMIPDFSKMNFIKFRRIGLERESLLETMDLMAQKNLIYICLVTYQQPSKKQGIFTYQQGKFLFGLILGTIFIAVWGKFRWQIRVIKIHAGIRVQFR